MPVIKIGEIGLVLKKKMYNSKKSSTIEIHAETRVKDTYEKKKQPSRSQSESYPDIHGTGLVLRLLSLLVIVLLHAFQNLQPTVAQLDSM